MTTELWFTGNKEADRLLAADPLALLIGMLLDQQVPMEWAFGAPRLLAERLGGALDAATIAGLEPEGLEAVFRGPPALHRYPAMMAKRTQALCAVLVDEHAGDAARVWREATDGADLLWRLRALPGFGEQKARIFVALLGKRFGLDLPGWREAAGPYGQPGHRSIADVTDAEALERVRAVKRAAKQDVRQA